MAQHFKFNILIINENFYFIGLAQYLYITELSLFE